MNETSETSVASQTDPTLLPGDVKTEPENALTPVQPAIEIVSFCEIECRVVLHKGMFCLVHAYNSQKVKIKMYQVELTPDEYNNWVSDVEMEALILSKCGLTKI